MPDYIYKYLQYGTVPSNVKTVSVRYRYSVTTKGVLVWPTTRITSAMCCWSGGAQGLGPRLQALLLLARSIPAGSSCVFTVRVHISVRLGSTGGSYAGGVASSLGS